MPFIFYEIDLLLEYQNRESKHFWLNQDSFLQEFNKLFWLWVVMNRVIIGTKYSGRHPTKNTLFDILSLANQLYHSWSTGPDNPELGKCYFSENSYPDLWDKALKKLYFNQSVQQIFV